MKKTKENRKVAEVARCIECGAEVKPGRILCLNCRAKHKRHYFENCFGPGVLLLGGFIGLVVAIVKAFH